MYMLSLVQDSLPSLIDLETVGVGVKKMSTLDCFLLRQGKQIGKFPGKLSLRLKVNNEG